MIKEIAVYVNSIGEVTDFDKTGFIKVFSKNNNQWIILREFPFEFHSTKEKPDIPLDALNIAEALESCRIFVAREFSDLAHKILDSMGFSTWKMDSSPSNFLEYVLEKEEEEAKAIRLLDYSNYINKKENISPIEIDNNGNYILNLKELQEHNTGVTTKQALKPFLKNKYFNELIVTCNHVPYWLEKEIDKMNFSFQFSETGRSDYIIVIKNK